MNIVFWREIICEHICGAYRSNKNVFFMIFSQPPACSDTFCEVSSLSKCNLTIHVTCIFSFTILYEQQWMSISCVSIICLKDKHILLLISQKLLSLYFDSTFFDWSRLSSANRWKKNQKSNIATYLLVIREHPVCLSSHVFCLEKSWILLNHENCAFIHTDLKIECIIMCKHLKRTSFVYWFKSVAFNIIPHEDWPEKLFKLPFKYFFKNIYLG